MEKVVGLARDLCGESDRMDRGIEYEEWVSKSQAPRGSSQHFIANCLSAHEYITTMRNEQPVGLDPLLSSRHQTYRWRGQERPGYT